MPATLHRARGSPRIGLALALATVLLWGLLAIALRLIIVGGMDAVTITWYRLTASAALLAGFQAWRGRLPAPRRIGRGGWILLAVALTGLLSNYVLFAGALSFVPPATAQLVIQLAPILLLIGALVVYREPFTGPQWFGAAGLLLGLLVFFNDRLPALLDLSGREAIGVAMVVASAVLWAIYALAQKQLLLSLSSVNILLLIYTGAAVVLLPFARPGQIALLDGLELGLLAFGVFNTLAAYGCFVEALEHWDASRVSAVISQAPVVTIAAVSLILALWPEADVGSPIDALGLAGAGLVVGGSMLTALWRRDLPVPAVEPE